jgi:type II restriction/modification system DNA methylase subunit YeeA
MTPQEFITKWQRANLSERSACQQHFLDLCDLLGQAKPAEADPDGTFYTFERGVSKTGGEQGWADVWKREHFAWEYKGKHKDLKAAYKQLLDYREDLENPPLLVVCDLDRFEVHTNFTNTPKRVYAFDLAALAKPQNLDVLRKLFTDAEALHPEVRAETITKEAAERFGELAKRLGMHPGVDSHRAAHFLMKLIFCMFGEDIKLLPPNLFTKLLDSAKANPAMLTRRLENLFAAMAKGGDFGADEIKWFNGGLFDDTDVLPLRAEEINILAALNEYDWSNVEPAIFGTLFERSLDPEKRSQIGAHYTSKEDILTLLEPVLMAPLRREWEEVKRRCEEKLWPKIEKATRKATGKKAGVELKATKERKAFDKAIRDFAERLHHVTVLDPACGSGNFLYVSINLLLDLEKEVITYAAAHGLSLIPLVKPTQLLGLEINAYAQELAQVVIWIGYLQWMYHNGFKLPSDPILEPIETIRCQDSILDLSDPESPREPEWPAAEFIVGNPPFLGGKLLRKNLGDDYVDVMFRVWDGRVPREADLCCYWFEKARNQLESRKCERAGLLATQGIRGGANRRVLERIKGSGEIFFAVSDREWILEGANVHVSMVGFDCDHDVLRSLDGRLVATIHSNLTAESDITVAKPIQGNLGLCYMGDTKGGAFEIGDEKALEFLCHPNPHGRPNSDVVTPWMNGLDVTRRLRNMWIIDFGVGVPVEEAAKYDLPFEHVERRVRPVREKNSRESYRDKWWIHVEPRRSMRESLKSMGRFLVTVGLAKHRLFLWVGREVLADHQLSVFARSDDSFFGILHSRIHEVWALKLGTRLETRPRYTSTTCFETFPFPIPSEGQSAAIAEAARELDELRNRWLNPPEWTKTEVLEFPGSVDGPWARYIDAASVGGPRPSPLPKGEGTKDMPSPRAPLPKGEGRVGTVRWPRVVAKDVECAESLKKRTLTNLYNQRPQWLQNAHAKLDAAVFAAYGWDPGMSDDEILAGLLKLNLEQSGGGKV